jgi:MFS family permease
LGYYSLALGLGLAAGPLLGAFLLSVTTYTMAFYIFGLILLAATIASKKFTPKDPFYYSPLGAEITYKDFLLNPEASWCLLISTFSFVFEFYINPTIGV